MKDNSIDDDNDKNQNCGRLKKADVREIKKQKFWFAAWAYYVATLVPVLGILQVGSQAMADRYTYLPSLGPFLVIGMLIYDRLKPSKNYVRTREYLFLVLAGIIGRFTAW
jgi:hypothetical protein